MYMTGGTTGMIFRIGESVEVELEEATPLKGGLLFSLLDGGTYGGNPKTDKQKKRPVSSLRPETAQRKTLTHVHRTSFA